LTTNIVLIVFNIRGQKSLSVGEFSVICTKMDE